MLSVLSCVSNDHDYGLLLVAVAICVVGSWIAIRTFVRARAELDEKSRPTWVAVASVSTAAAVWATHFVAMLAFKPGLEVGWNVPLIIASLVLATATSALGITIGTNRRLRFAPEIGGAIIGLGIALMHFTGMEAFEVPGRIHWSEAKVLVAICIGLIFGTIAFNRAARPVTRFCKYGATFALVVAICGLHFTGMSAISIIPDPTVVVQGAVTTEAFGYLVSFVALLVIGGNVVAYAIDRRGSAAAMARLRKLANATPEGILIARDGLTSDANDRFTAMVGRPLAAVVGTDPQSFWSDWVSSGSERVVVETDLLIPEHDPIPVQITATGDTAGEVIYAILDLRARRAAERRIDHLARHDALTGLFNRTRFSALAAEAITAGTSFAMILVNLDRFKEINDIKGRAAGDAMLIEVGRRIQTEMVGCVMGRLNGDEFAVLKSLDSAHPDDGADALSIALSRPMTHAGVIHKMSSSIGVSRFPDDAADLASLIENADIALEAVKGDDRGGIGRFEASMGAAVRRRKTLSHDLLTAVANRELEVFYQPQTKVTTEAIIGFEALVRWHHPSLGFISPADFIPLAEENGSIREIGTWVMRRACFDAANWPSTVTIAVNLSAIQLKHDVLAVIRSALGDSGLAPERLEIEITESVLINDFDTALDVLRQIKALGCSIAMDDFGTGYSSLSSLQAFPFDKLKIDRSFVDQLDRSPQAAAIVRAVVTLGHILDIPVLAEGVETKVHLDFLREQGCDSAQGYYFGKPTPLAGALRAMAPIPVAA